MPVFRIDNFVDAYRLRAQSADIHELAARPGKRAVTDYVSRQILEAMQPGPDDTLVDIGCGDATLLRLASGHSGKCIGIVGTVEEKIRLEGVTSGVYFIASNAQKLHLESASASKIVCNGMLFYLSTEKAVRSSLREIARIARPGAIIWVGEMPVAEEGEHYRRYRGNSMIAFLWFLLRHNGLRSFLGMIRRLLQAVFGSERIILNSAEMFYTEPEAFIPLAEGCGLRLKTHFRHKELDDEGKVVESKFRYDYVFTV
jgi:SAM-dependent methyltransferase